MEESKKKPIMIGVIVVCFAVAGGITFLTRSGGSSGGVPASFANELTWMKCRNPDCGNEWQISLKDYYEFMEDFRIKNPSLFVDPAYICPKCSEESGYQATKCEKCGFIFELGAVPRDFEDRCPKCKFSKIEKQRAERAGGQNK